MNYIFCPFCKSQIEADSWFCDKCGKELRTCISCGATVKSVRCTKCGGQTKTSKEYFSSKTNENTPQGFETSEKNVAIENDETFRPSMNTSLQKSLLPGHLQNYSNNIRLLISDGAVIGRKGDYADVFADYKVISGLHARMQINKEGEWEIVDLGSTNGTMLNGDKLRPQVPMVISVGDVVSFADMDFKVLE